MTATTLVPFQELIPSGFPLPAERTDRALVLIELAGGCDGLNMIVPFADAEYRLKRPHLALPPEDVLAFEEGLGFHPALAGIKDLFDQGWVSVVHGVGHPDPPRTHFEARLRAPHAPLDSMPEPILNPVGIQLDRSVDQPAHALNLQLKRIAQAIGRGSSRKVYKAVLEGFDTHVDQVTPGRPSQGRHARLLADLSDGICNFLSQIETAGAQREVLVMVWTEFGRRLEENQTLGTDHGTAAPVLLIGESVQAGSVGTMPGLSPAHLDSRGDLALTTDWRSVSSSILSDWLEIDPGSFFTGDVPRVRLV